MVIVHIVDQNGENHSIECATYKESNNGLALYEEPRITDSNICGYVPYDRLSHVAPSDDS